MFKKHTIALALLMVASTSATVFAAQRVYEPYASRHHHYVTSPGTNAAEIERFFNGNQPEGWPYYPN